MFRRPLLSLLLYPLLAAPHLRDAVGQLLVVHGHALGLVQRHEGPREEALRA
jgi:hypothetical protein